MVAKALNIAECPDLESLWDMGRDMPVTRQIQLSHSDIGPYVHFVCPEEHHVVGPAMVTCLKGGVWDDITEPYCSSSSMYGIPQSDTLLIGVLSGSAAIVLITLTVILTHLFCLRSSTVRKTTSSDDLHRSEESLPSTTYYVDDRSYCSISAPSCPTMNGKPLKTVTRGQLFTDTAGTGSHQQQSQPLHYSDSRVPHTDYFGRPEDRSAHAPRLNGHVARVGDENVFVNFGFNPEQRSVYSNHWETSQSTRSQTNTFQMTSLDRNIDGNSRRSSSDGASYDHSRGYPVFPEYSIVNRTVL